ncbi:MAG: hypothetical protein JXB17_05115 [Bacteroidales bacterium]|nr:hypothetical protein [Bacteroidales bacterium]
MRITVNNYRIYYDQFLNGTLESSLEIELMNFLDLHPEYIKEEDLSSSFLFKDVFFEFAFKNELKKTDDDLSDYELYAIKKVENEIDDVEQKHLTQIAINDPFIAGISNIYKKTRLKPDLSVVYKSKRKIKRYLVVINKKVVAWSAVASIFFMFILLNYNSLYKRNNTNNLILSNISEEVVISNEKKNIVKKDRKAKKEPSKQVKTNRIKKTNEKKAHPINPYIELDEPLLAKIECSTVDHILEPPIVNGYEIALNEIMNVYIDNQIKMSDLCELSDKNIEVKKPLNLTGFKLIEGSVRITNLFMRKKIKLNKYFDDQGKMIAYKLKGEGLEWTKRLKDE